ncbi:SRPBCC domain-containing protein [bacterium]|nr:MAG: SRPBCC domain-containing protein [bacterium]
MIKLETDITIDAPVTKVWEVLTQFEQHTRWNPFIKSIQGVQKVGEQLQVFIKPPDGNGMKFKPTVLRFDAEKEFRWKGKFLIKGLFDGEHYFILSKISEQQTRLIHGEVFSGFLVPFMAKTLIKTKEGFQLMNQALKLECEKQNSLKGFD